MVIIYLLAVTFHATHTQSTVRTWHIESLPNITSQFLQRVTSQAIVKAFALMTYHSGITPHSYCSCFSLTIFVTIRETYSSSWISPLQVVNRYINQGVAELVPGVLFIDEVHRLIFLNFGILAVSNIH